MFRSYFSTYPRLVLVRTPMQIPICTPKRGIPGQEDVFKFIWAGIRNLNFRKDLEFLPFNWEMPDENGRSKTMLFRNPSVSSRCDSLGKNILIHFKFWQCSYDRHQIFVSSFFVSSVTLISEKGRLNEFMCKAFYYCSNTCLGKVKCH